MGNTSTIGPFLMGNTNPDGTVRGAYSACRMLFNGLGFSFQTSDETSGKFLLTATLESGQLRLDTN
jgi:hypothetical protein